MIRRLLPYLLSMALCSPAFAFTAGNIVTYSDSTGAKVQDSGIPAAGVASHVATLAALQATTTATYPNGVWRDDYSAGLGAPPLRYLPETGTCVANSRVNDGGSCVNTTSGGNSWFTPISTELDVREFGATNDGATDSTAAFNACLTAMVGHTCAAPGRFALTSANVVIPAQTTLYCSSGIPDIGGVPTNFTLNPALILSSAHSITGDGTGGQHVAGCVIYRSGMTFPTTTAPQVAAFAGTAITDGNSPGFQVTDSVIMGFESAYFGTGERPYLRNVNFDASGGDGTTTTHAGIDIRNANTESGYLENIKALGFSGLSDTNCNNLRPGTGIRMDGIDYFGGTLTIENYQVADIEVAGLILGERWWTDYIPTCSRGSSVGVLIKANGVMRINNLYTFSMETGIQDLSNNSGSASYIGEATFQQVGGDCIQMGDTGVSAGLLTIGTIATIPGAAACAGHVVNFLDNTDASSIQINSGAIINSGAATPYIQPLAAHTNANQIAVSPRIVTDASPTSSLYGAPVVTSPTGIGSTGTATFVATSLATPFTGAVTLTAGGSGITNTGNVPMTWPVKLMDYHGCQATLSNGSAQWPPGSAVNPQSIDSTHTTFVWYGGGGTSLTTGQTYIVNYNCLTQ